MSDYYNPDSDNEFELELVVNSDESSDSCCVCQQKMTCLNCYYESKTTEITSDIKTVDEVTRQTYENTVDVKLLSNALLLTTIDNDVISLKKNQVTVKSYDKVRRDEHNWFPLAKDIKSKDTLLSNYYCVDAHEVYGHSDKQKTHYSKVIVDNNIRCVGLVNYSVVSIDIETYND